MGFMASLAKAIDDKFKPREAMIARYPSEGSVELYKGYNHSNTPLISRIDLPLYTKISSDLFYARGRLLDVEPGDSRFAAFSHVVNRINELHLDGAFDEYLDGKPAPITESLFLLPLSSQQREIIKKADVSMGLRHTKDMVYDLLSPTRNTDPYPSQRAESFVRNISLFRIADGRERAKVRIELELKTTHLPWDVRRTVSARRVASHFTRKYPTGAEEFATISGYIGIHADERAASMNCLSEQSLPSDPLKRFAQAEYSDIEYRMYDIN